MTTKTRRKIDAELKAKIALEAVRGQATLCVWRIVRSRARCPIAPSPAQLAMWRDS